MIERIVQNKEEAVTKTMIACKNILGIIIIQFPGSFELLENDVLSDGCKKYIYLNSYIGDSLTISIINLSDLLKVYLGREDIAIILKLAIEESISYCNKHKQYMFDDDMLEKMISDHIRIQS